MQYIQFLVFSLTFSLYRVLQAMRREIFLSIKSDIYESVIKKLQMSNVN
jgi:hypothetical protein